jgi:ferritin-like metal-binding protein YciE
MATILSLRAHLIDELTDLLSAEQQLQDALPQMAGKAASRQLRAAFTSHLRETKGHARRVSQALQLLGEKPSSKTCEAMKGLLEEGQELMESGEPGPLRDAMMITAAQKVEHYEIASYGTVRTYAQLLGERSVAKLLAQNLKEEKAADRKLTGIAEGGLNTRAAAEWHEQSGMLAGAAQWVGSTVSAVARGVMPQSKGARKSSRGRSVTATRRDRAAEKKSRR